MKLEIKLTTGLTMKVEPIRFFKENNTSKNYLFFTKNEVMENGLVKMYVSEVVESKKTEQIDEATWTNIKTFMKNSIKGKEDPSFTDLGYKSSDVNLISESKIIGLTKEQIAGIKMLKEKTAETTFESLTDESAAAKPAAPAVDLETPPVPPVVAPPTPPASPVSLEEPNLPQDESPLFPEEPKVEVEEKPVLKEDIKEKEIDINSELMRLEELNKEFAEILLKLKKKINLNNKQTVKKEDKVVMPFNQNNMDIPITEKELNQEDPAVNKEILLDKTEVNLFDSI